MGGKERGLPKAGPTFSVATMCAPLPRDWSRVAACDVIGLHAHGCLSPCVCMWVPPAVGQRGPTGRTVLERAEALPCCQTGQAWGSGDTSSFLSAPLSHLPREVSPCHRVSSDPFRIAESQAVRTSRRALMWGGSSSVRVLEQREQFPRSHWERWQRAEGFPGPRPPLPPLGAAIRAGLFWV